MNDEKTHPLLAQVPLAVSPYIHLPTAPTLPYTYKSLPSTLPPSVLDPPQQQQQQQSACQDPAGAPKPAYVISTSGGAAAHPSDILASCRALQQHLEKLQQDAERELEGWERERREKELAEKRRLAPGWLDSEQRLLEPTRVQSPSDSGAGNAAGFQRETGPQGGLGMEMGQQQGSSKEGEELDRMFGGMEIK
ncbi:hypothetical protein EV356DRAFT_534356 [Viridothelium virens]|uniref:Uncharacterized protein n=1 Tax=Viridothelium virens TaxID=1048519 RepID=A0A6A6H4S3_VIRVR|nr:hypothetical protein EV356DRAFT_534356 [Viridothelium virens]